MVIDHRNSCSAFNLSKVHTHPAVHAHTQQCTHTPSSARTHPAVHAHTQQCTHTHSSARTHTAVHAHTQQCTHTHSSARTHTAVHAHTQQCTHTHSSEHTHTHTAVNTHTHTAVNTHTHTAVNTHPEQWAAIYAVAPGEQLEVRWLAQGHHSHGIEGGECCTFTPPPPTIPAGPRIEPTTFGLRAWLSNPGVSNFFTPRTCYGIGKKYCGGWGLNGCVVGGVFKTGLFIYQHVFSFCMPEVKTFT